MGDVFLVRSNLEPQGEIEPAGLAGKCSQGQPAEVLSGLLDDLIHQQCAGTLPAP